MTPHDTPNHHRAGRRVLVVGASVALGLVASVGLQFAGDAPIQPPAAVTAECANFDAGSASTAL
jgi:trans-2-enoyl-CoA reductase